MGNEKQYEELSHRIVYDETIFESEKIYKNVLTNLLNDSKYIGLSIRFPFEDYFNRELPLKYANWQIRCSIELYQGIGKENLKSYAENGLAWTRDNSNISNDLYQEIMPKVGVIHE